MTDLLKKLIKEHKKALYASFDEEGEYGDNLYYSVLHEDGVVSNFMSYVCFANIYGDYGTVRRYARQGDPDIGNFESQAKLTHIIVHCYGENMRPDDDAEELSSYHQALEEWFEMFSPLLVPASFQERLKNGFIVDLEGADIDCVGALLVGFRNLGEQGYHRSFNYFRKQGFNSRQSAVLSQYFSIRAATGEVVYGNESHNILSSHRFVYLDKKDIQNIVNGCPLFDPEQMKNETDRSFEHQDSLYWSIGRYLEVGGISKNCLSELVFSPAAIVRKDTWGYEYTSYDLDKVTENLKKFLQ